MSNKPGRSEKEKPQRDPGRAYLYNKPNLSPASSLQRPSSTSTRRTHSRTGSQSSTGQGPAAYLHNDADADGPPAAVAAQAALASLSKITLSASEPPSTATTSEISDDISELGHPMAPDRWQAAVGNIEDAKVALDVIARAIDDAVYLDEDAYNQMLPLQQYTRTIEAQQRRIGELEQQLQAARRRISEQDATTQAARKRAVELQEELENNAAVFKLHYDELLAKDAELAKLRAVVQGLSSGR
ncbi:g3504 [Coccomyxa elongata]